MRIFFEFVRPTTTILRLHVIMQFTVVGFLFDGALGGGVRPPKIQMTRDIPSSLPKPHGHFIRRLIELLKVDSRIVGVAAGGSYLTNTMDSFSDLDLVIAVEPRECLSVMSERRQIAASLGQLLASFTGEHVGEPRLLICLYDAPLLHVDLKFVNLEDVSKRVEDPAILWEREGRFSKALKQEGAKFPAPDPQWIEERFWIWVHYAAAKIGRGELFETIGFLSFIRGNVLGPMGLLRAGDRPSGVRKIEKMAPEFAEELRRTVARYDAADCLRALRASAEIYRSIRPIGQNNPGNEAAERAAMEYLSELERICLSTPSRLRRQPRRI